MVRVVFLEWPIQKLADYDDEEYEQVGMIASVERETLRAVLLRVYAWQCSAWFPRDKLRVDEKEVIWCEARFYHVKRREYGGD